MPTQKPRLALTVSPELQVALSNLAVAVGRPAATVAAELLEDMLPQLEGLTKIAKSVKDGNKVAAKRALQHLLGDAFAEAMATQQPDLFKNRRARRVK